MKMDLLCEEQNGFRKLRSCLDHLYTLVTVIRNRKEQNVRTFLCFVDFAKAFDSVNRDCLWYKLQTIGINGRIYNIIKSLYWNIEPATVNRLTDCNLLLTQMTCINQLNVDVPMSETDSISVLLYVEDIVLMAQNAEDLQRMAHVLREWTIKWHLSLNVQNSHAFPN